MQFGRSLAGLLAAVLCVSIWPPHARLSAQAQLCAALAAGATAWYRGEGVAADSLGVSHGVLTGNPVFSAGKVGQAFNFDGLDDAVKFNAAPALNIGAGGGLTIECWLNPQSVGTTQSLLEWHNGANGVGLHLWLAAGQSGLYANLVDSNGAEHIIRTPNNPLTANVFQHVALTYDKSSGLARFYLNGAEIRQENLGAFTPQTSFALYLGRRPLGGAALYKGLLDELTLYNRALSAAELQAVFNAGSQGKCPNTPPGITIAAALTRSQGSSARAPVAMVSDGQTPAGELIVTATSVPAGLTINGFNNSNGALTALVAANCNAAPGNQIIELTVSDGQGVTAKANLTVNVTANTPPVLGGYPDAILFAQDRATLTPNIPPTDNGALVSLTATAQDFSGQMSVNPVSGVVTISNAGRGGREFTIALTATDNCGATARTSFRLTVNSYNAALTLTLPPGPYFRGQPVNLTVLARPQGQTSIQPTGLIVFQDAGRTIGTAPLDAAGRAVFTAANLAQGPHTFSARYDGDINYHGGANSAVQTSYVYGALANVSAASFRGESFAAQQIIAAFGAGFASVTQAATTLPLPTTLANVTVRVKDRAGVERAAPLFFVSPEQVNYVLPAGTAAGAATVTVTGVAGLLALETVQVTAVAPGVFAANADGRGVAAAQIVRTLPDGAQQFEPVMIFDSTANSFIALPIDLGETPGLVSLILYGTGFRAHSNLANVRTTLGGASFPVQFAGAQGGFAGLDQVNVQLPFSLRGRGEIEVVLVVEGRAANAVRINVR